MSVCFRSAGGRGCREDRPPADRVGCWAGRLAVDTWAADLDGRQSCRASARLRRSAEPRILNVNGDTFVPMLVANADDEIDHDGAPQTPAGLVYNGTKTVTAEEIDLNEYHDVMARADQAD